MKGKNRQLVNSLNRGLIILEKMMDEESIGITEMGKYLNINKSSAYRLLSTLEDRGYVEQNPVTSKYKLGFTFTLFAEKVQDNLEIRKIAKPFLKELIDRTKECAHLCILFQSMALLIDQEKSPEIFSVNTRIGISEPVYCSSVGKALLGFLPEDEQERLINDLELKPYTVKTITNIETLRYELKKILEKGYAIDDEEIYPGVRCIAAPILNHKGKVLASVGISGPISRIRIENMDEYIKVITDVAKRISQKLG